MVKKFTSWNDFPGYNINSNSINDKIFRRKASIKEISGSVDSVIICFLFNYYELFNYYVFLGSIYASAILKPTALKIDLLCSKYYLT